ncbi:nucleoside triphosphatase YtkD [Bacillus canaveralius]|uniref:Nucleoside triphosphatase YtkD n=1 Tax=Bacillus canaveralius TaxID=1403243 RepID=A0A2N5GPD8_9BACI|nr:MULTISPECIES: nucleoside triphosphatase YtkD [Bacillus]PLR84438.1 nucleoside triphosphatase YtkD [Bacillus canaveralius]PLR86977.1 nucleoside triphosphatase YtkD [Bacillus sp. V33-4]PLS00560.1 nucleoside triphosphatase YtkD [Bacillus canaveralius]RSK57845.1 nucleoside triphosphatase YtkD [Bacillus canaveralius]
MKEFHDQNGQPVRLSFQPNQFSLPSRHVLVICRFQDKWLLTSHKIRGLEFPGGKTESGETLEEAARREVFEETGARLQSLHYVGEYEVGGEIPFVKTIFYGVVERIEERETFFETNGPVFISGPLLKARLKDEYSFIMQDDVIATSLLEIKRKFDSKMDI